MNSLILFSRKNQLANKIIINKWNISNRNYSRNVNLKINYNLNGLLIFSSPSQNFDIYTQCPSNLLISHRNYSNANQNLIKNNDGISINDILKDVNEINESSNIHNPQTNNSILENQPPTNNISQKNGIPINNIKENKIETDTQYEKVSEGFFSRLFKKNKKIEIQSETNIKFQNEVTLNENVTLQTPLPPQSPNPTSEGNVEIPNINNIINETTNEINNSNNIEVDVLEGEIPLNEVKIHEINNLQDIPFKPEPEPINPSIKENTIKKEDTLNNTENNGFLGWVSSLLYGKKPNNNNATPGNS